MDTVGETSFATPGDRELEITRTFDASRQAVFDAFTVCEAARRWMGPPGWEVAGCEIDLRPGGVYRFVWKSPQGYEVDNGGTCNEVSSRSDWSRRRMPARAGPATRSSSPRRGARPR